MLVEFVGISGSGKSTLIKAIAEQLRASDSKVRNFYKFCRAAKLLDTAHWKRNAPEAELLEQHRLLSLMNFCAEHPALTENLGRALKALPSQQSQVAITLASLKQFSQLDHHTLVVIADEGFLHRGVVAHAEAGDAAEFEAFLSLAVLPDVLVRVGVTPDLAEARAISRVGPKRRAAAKAARPSLGYFARLSAMFEALAVAATDRGCVVIELDSEMAVDANARVLVDRLGEFIGSVRA